MPGMKGRCIRQAFDLLHLYCWDVKFLRSVSMLMTCTFVRLTIDEQGKTESVVQQLDDGYTRETGFVRSSAAYGVQE
ncbi:hypothetical protein T08_12785 [Trichinella sp. T8]|nr:hypothetical protein T08_12785 [Trichinella sp. T8]